MRPVKNLTLEAMIDKLSATFSRMPDERMAERVDYSLDDTLMSGFALMNFSASEPVTVSAGDEAESKALSPGDDLQGEGGAVRHADARDFGWG